MKKITLLLIVMLSFWRVESQVSSYSFAQSNGTYTPITGGTVLGSTTSDDERYVDPIAPLGATTATGIGFPIGFNFTYNGFVYDRFAVNNNGWISFGTSGTTPSVNLTSTSSYTCLSSTSTTVTNDLVARFAAFARDMQSQVGGELRFELTGTTPNQVLVVQWTNYRKYLATGDSYNFQIRAYETSNNIEVVYGLMQNNATTGTVHCGLRANPNNPASNFNSRTTTTSWSATTASAIATNTMAISATIFPVNGLTYTWTPPVLCTGTPIGGIVTPASLNLCTGSAVGNLVGSGYSTGVSGITFQWAESPDGTSWVNAVGGTGATTATYTPPVYSGTPIQYKLFVTCTASGLFASSTPSLIGSPATPTTQVTNAIGTNLLLVSATVNWTNGNGGRRLVVLSNSPSITDPTDGNAAALVANTVYAGSGQQIMYDGTAATVNITGLTNSTTYYGKVYEYLRCGAGPYDYYYNISAGTNVFTFTTPAPPANDDCSGALPLTVGSNFASNSVSGTILGAATTAGLIPSCQTLYSSDVWYTVTVPISGNLTIETQSPVTNAMTDSVVAVFSGACGTLTEVGCNDDAVTGFMSFLTLTGRTPGEVLYVGVWKYGTSSSTATNSQFLLSAYDCASTLPAPTGDAAQVFCASANPTVASLATTSGASIQWYDDAIVGNLLLSTDPIFPGATYYASQTVVCESFARLAVTVTITATPADPTGAAAQTFCAPGSPDLTTLAVTSGGTGLVWYDAPTLGNVLPDTTIITATTYYVSSIDGACESSGRLAVTTSEFCPPEVCLVDLYGQWPGSVFVPDNAQCNGVTSQVIVNDGFGGEYSMVTVALGETYVFTSSIVTDVITIGTSDGATAYTSGFGSVTWVASISGDVRFYTHLSGCDGDFTSRVRSVTCGIPSTDLPDYANLQWPPTLTFAQGGSGTVYGQVYEAGLTNVEPGYTGQAAGITAWIGVSPLGSNTNPNTWTDWTPATWNATHVSNNDEYQAAIGATLTPGTYYYATRFRLNAGLFVYGGIDGSNNGNIWDGTTYNSGVLTVTPPPPPVNDNCSGAIVLVAGGVFADNAVVGALLGSTDSAPPAPGCAGFLGDDVWYSVTVPTSGSITVETDAGTVITDTGIAVYSGDCSTLSLVSCNDDGGSGFFSLISLTGRTPGEVLYVDVWQYNGGTDGTFQVSAYDSSLATASFDSTNFTYYPNPVKNILNLSYTQNISSVAVFNLLGQEVVSKVVNANQSQIDMSDLPTGAYLVKVTADSQVKTIKVMKE